MKNILIISTCKYSLHELEFVNPVRNILEEESIQYSLNHISKVNKIKDLNSISHIIICGTAIKDFSYNSYNINSFLKEVEELQIPTLGICAGAQVISNYKQISLAYNFQSNVIEFRAINSSKNLQIKKDDTISGYALHSYCINSNDIKNNFSEFSVTPILVNSANYKYIELAEIAKITLSFFHIEIKNKNLLKNWMKN